jgi:large subunit ribosomal protein L30
MPRQIEITYTRSSIGRSQRQRRTIEALGLRKLQQTVRRPDNPTTRGMVESVRHLVTWREVEEGNES